MAFVLAELVVAALLVAVVFVVLIWQPIWMWVIAGLVMLAAFIGIAVLAKSRTRSAQILVLACPLSYTVWLVGLGVSIQGNAAGLWASAIGYYAAGVVLLGIHLLIYVRLR